MSLSDAIKNTPIYADSYYDNRHYEFTSNSYGYGSVDWQKKEWEKLKRQGQEQELQRRKEKELKALWDADIKWFESKVKGETVTFKIGDRVEVKEGFKNAGKVGYYQGRSLLNKDTHLVRFEGKNKDTKVVLDALQLKPYTREEKVERLIEDFEALFPCINYSPNERNALAALLLADGVVLP